MALLYKEIAKATYGLTEADLKNWEKWVRYGRPLLRAGGLEDQPAPRWSKFERIDTLIEGLCSKFLEAQAELKQQEIDFETAFNNTPLKSKADRSQEEED